MPQQRRRRRTPTPIVVAEQQQQPSTSIMQHQAPPRRFTDLHQQQHSPVPFYHPPAPISSMPLRTITNGMQNNLQNNNSMTASQQQPSATRSNKRTRSTSPVPRNVRRRAQNASPAPATTSTSPTFAISRFNSASPQTTQRRHTIVLDAAPTVASSNSNDDVEAFDFWFGPDSMAQESQQQSSEPPATNSQQPMVQLVEADWEDIFLPSPPIARQQSPAHHPVSSDESDGLEFYEEASKREVAPVVVSSDDDDDDNDDDESSNESTYIRNVIAATAQRTRNRAQVAAPPRPRTPPSPDLSRFVRSISPPRVLPPHLLQPQQAARPLRLPIVHTDHDYSGIPAHQRARFRRNSNQPQQQQQHQQPRNRHQHQHQFLQLAPQPSTSTHNDMVDPFMLSNAMLYDFHIPPTIHRYSPAPPAPVAIPSAPIDTSHMTPQELADFEIARRLQEEENAAFDQNRAMRQFAHHLAQNARWRNNNNNAQVRPQVAAMLDTVFLQRHRNPGNSNRHMMQLNYVDRDFNDDDYEMLLQLDDAVPKKTAATTVKTISSVQAGKEHAGTSCVICMCDIELGESLKALPTCKHTYHGACIDKWLSDYNNSCPICKQEF